MPSRGDGQPGPVPAPPPRLHRPLGPDPTVLVVGYPAPAAVAIVDRLLASDPRTIACVVARDRRPEAARLHRTARATGRLRLFEGSAGAPGLGLAHTAWRILDTTDEIYGVASGRDLAAGHLQDFADECPRLRELHLVDLDLAGRDRVASPSPSRWDAVRRVGGRLMPARVRSAVSGLTTALALGVAGVTIVVPSASDRGLWRDLLDFDVETALSWEDLERDLWPGSARAA